MQRTDAGGPHLVVVGGGPTGVTAACLLARYGVPVTVLERYAGAFPYPRAVHLDDEVCRILARVGAYEQFAAVSRPAGGLRLLEGDLGVLAEFARGTERGVHGYPQANMFDQPDLERILRGNAAGRPEITWRSRVEVIGLTTAPDGSVRVHLSGGETVDADWVLGCDGANSTVRAAIGSHMRDLGFEQRWLVVDVATDTGPGAWEGVHQVCDPDRAATYMRVGPRRHRWEFRLRDGETAAAYQGREALLPLLRPWMGDLDGAELVRVAEYTFRARVADRWRRGRVLLLGDAAHLTPPFIGQGLGAGLRDVDNLAWKLAGVVQGRFGEAVLDSYEAERAPHVRTMIRLAVLVGHAMTAGGRAGVVLRRHLAPRLRYVPGLRARVLDSATPRVGRSPYARRAPGPGRLGGTLAPNLELADGRRLDEVDPTGFLLVTTGDVAGSPATVLRVDPGEPLGRWLRRGLATAALVRPDGTVLAAGRDAGRLLSHLPAAPAAPAPPT